jgi:hypothetical protein
VPDFPSTAKENARQILSGEFNGHQAELPQHEIQWCHHSKCRNIFLISPTVHKNSSDILAYF